MAVQRQRFYWLLWELFPKKKVWAVWKHLPNESSGVAGYITRTHVLKPRKSTTELNFFSLSHILSEFRRTGQAWSLLSHSVSSSRPFCLALLWTRRGLYKALNTRVQKYVSFSLLAYTGRAKDHLCRAAKKCALCFLTEAFAGVLLSSVHWNYFEATNSLSFLSWYFHVAVVVVP